MTGSVAGTPAMSLQGKEPPLRPLSAIEPGQPYQGRSMERSHSFTLSQRSLSSPGPGTGAVLGEAYRKSPAVTRRPPSSPIGPFHLRRGQKLPKIPRPARALTMFASLKNGLRECVEATEEDVIKLKVSENITGGSSTGQGRVIELEKQARAAERYKKRLEYQLAQVEELEEKYVLHQQLREGVKNMAKAYVSVPSEHKKESLDNVKCGFKECTQILCAIEAQLESMLGTFHCQMKGMAGFARIAPGDVFQVTVVHGHQKWKIKGRIGLTMQSWDKDSYVFKALLCDVFNIKAMESRTLGRDVLLGQKNCETKDLMSSHPQLMTVNINSNGSLKLSIVITWNPLEGTDEGFQFYEGNLKTSQIQMLPRRVSVMSNDDLPSHLIGGSPNRNVELRKRPVSVSDLQTSPHHEVSHRLSMPPGCDFDLLRTQLESKGHPRPNSVAIMGSINESIADSLDLSKQKQRLFDMRMLAECLDSPVSSRAGTECSHLEDLLHTLLSTLEDYRGQYQELACLEDHVRTLDTLLRGSLGATTSQRSSDISISIENALGAFDFLESEDYHEGYGSASNSRRCSMEQLEAISSLSPESTTKTADSGIESIGKRLAEEDCSIPSSPEPASSGNEQVDQALTWHLTYCQRLIENLGNFGPLRCREIYSLEKLKKQAEVLGSLVQIAQEGAVITNLTPVMKELTERRDVRHFWMRCVESNVICTYAERFMAQLERSFGDLVRDSYDVSASKVFRILVARILDVALFDPELQPSVKVTMHQFFSFFMDVQEDMDSYLKQLAGELWVCSRLRSGDTDIVIKTILTFYNCLPPTEALRIIALLLMADNIQVRDTATKYISHLNDDPVMREKAVIVFVDALEDKNADVRCAAAMALKLVKGLEALEQLVFICQSDPSHMVKVKAKDTLLSFGDEGVQAYEQSQLSYHGFQGVQVKL